MITFEQWVVVLLCLMHPSSLCFPRSLQDIASRCSFSQIYCCGRCASIPTPTTSNTLAKNFEHRFNHCDIFSFPWDPCMLYIYMYYHMVISTINIPQMFYIYIYHAWILWDFKFACGQPFGLLMWVRIWVCDLGAMVALQSDAAVAPGPFVTGLHYIFTSYLYIYIYWFSRYCRINALVTMTYT